MEPVTHFLTGACMGRAGLNRKTALATLTLTLAAEAPDLDVLGRFWGRTFGFAHHRGFTHSFLGVPIDAIVVLGFVYLIWRIRGRRTNNPKLSPRWGLLFFYACLAGLSHILLDFTNNYGVRPFWPFSEKWYSWDIVFIVEPVMLVLLILGLAVPAIFFLVDRDIGAHSRVPRGRVAATLALTGIVLMWGVRDYEHRRAVNALEARTYKGADPLRVSAYPKWVDPFHWYGVVETPTFFALTPVDSLAPEVDPEDRMEIHYKPEETPITLAAKRSYLGRVYLDWAQYPITETETLDGTEGGYVVTFQDLRYLGLPDAMRRDRRPRKTLSAAVKLDRNLRVVGDVYEKDGREIIEPDRDGH
ncbi:MAG TPA: metal-dependent hydrolase [Candidatus Sulfotelmatobacter sp.]|nr:metal-dependent hydrolase [Candidatus Sulfotelmatobacter sp.]